MSGIFINYRTGDGGDAAVLLDERLRKEFGDDRVFRDRRSMRPGDDFPPELRRELKRCTVLLALIGEKWLSIDNGSRRIDLPDDYVREEIRKALAWKKIVIPVLLVPARLPIAAELPLEIRKLARRQVLPFDVPYAQSQLKLIVDELRRHVPPAGEGDEGPAEAAGAPGNGSPGLPAGGVHITSDRGAIATGTNSRSTYIEKPKGPKGKGRKAS